jgi:hypothetical protein
MTQTLMGLVIVDSSCVGRKTILIGVYFTDLRPEDRASFIS